MNEAIKRDIQLNTAIYNERIGLYANESQHVMNLSLNFKIPASSEDFKNPLVSRKGVKVKQNSKFTKQNTKLKIFNLIVVGE